MVCHPRDWFVSARAGWLKMSRIEELTGSSSLSDSDLKKLQSLIAEWQLLADLSFADLLLWVPIRESESSWPEGHVIIAQMRPTTAATVYPRDLIGTKVQWGERAMVDAALSQGEILLDGEPEIVGEISIKEESIPVVNNDRVIAVISRNRNAELSRSSGRLEGVYRESANHLSRMIKEGSFPVEALTSEVTPRVGDGLIRLDVNGMVTFASPNAISAFRRLGLQGDLELQNLGLLAEALASQSSARLPRDESWQIILSGKNAREVEFENGLGIVDFYILPLSAGNDRIGALVLLHNVTEIRRREKELISKDATIREIHHRVKNNLQTVSALLRLQARRSDNAQAEAAIEEAVRRIASIALVHETLSTSAQEVVLFDDVLDRLISGLKDVGTRRDGVEISRKGEFGNLRPEIATPLALILTELIQNALEHGLVNTGTELVISVSRCDQELLIEVVDNGSGLPENFSLLTTTTLGLQIVQTLTTNELAGELEIIQNQPSGTKAIIRLTIF